MMVSFFIVIRIHHLQRVSICRNEPKIWKANINFFSLIDFRSIERGFACCPFDPSLDWWIELPPGRGVRILCD